jgi:hypothetical protein
MGFGQEGESVHVGSYRGVSEGSAQWEAVLTRPGSLEQRVRPRSAVVTERFEDGGDPGWARRSLYAVQPLVEC